MLGLVLGVWLDDLRIRWLQVLAPWGLHLDQRIAVLRMCASVGRGGAWHRRLAIRLGGCRVHGICRYRVSSFVCGMLKLLVMFLGELNDWLTG